MAEKTFPEEIWYTLSPESAGFDPDGLATAEIWLKDHAGSEPYRAVVLRHSHLIAEWQQGTSKDEKVKLASATKSVYSNMLSIQLPVTQRGSAGYFWLLLQRRAYCAGHGAAQLAMGKLRQLER